jgi:hypothetical protein
VRRLGDERDTPAVTSRGPRQAHLEGFDLHANVWVSANDRAGVERLCRYVLRPPFAQERLRLRSDGRVALELKTAWHDGTRELVFEPLEFLERLAAMTPRPETNLLICHGVLAPHGVVTLCILSSNTWNLEVVYIADATPWATVATLHHLFCGSANGVCVEHRRIDLPWGTRYHLCGLEEATRDEPSNHPRPDAEPIGGLVQREQGRRAGLVVVDRRSRCRSELTREAVHVVPAPVRRRSRLRLAAMS